MTTTTHVKARPVATALGALVHQLMWEQRISQTTVADQIGVGQSTVAKKLRGIVAISIDELVIIADLLGEEAGDLLLRACRDSNPKPSDLWSRVVGRLLGRCRCCPGSHRQGTPDAEWVLAV